jgi:hypothetical protein
VEEFGMMILWGWDENMIPTPAIYHGWFRLSVDGRSMEYRKKGGRKWVHFGRVDRDHEFWVEVK